MVPSVPVDSACLQLPGEYGFFHPSLLPIWFFCWESHFLLINWVVLAHDIVCQCRLVDLNEKLLPPCPGIVHPFQLFHVLLMLLFSYLQSPTSRSYVYSCAILAWNRIDYSCRFLERSLVLWVDQKLMQCLVWSYCSGYPMSSERTFHCLRHTLHVWYGYHNLLFSSLFYFCFFFLSSFCCFVILLSILFFTSSKDQSGQPHMLKALLK